MPCRFEGSSPRIVIAAAATASIATSSISWFTDQTVVLEQITDSVYADFSADGASEPPPGAGIRLGVTSLGPVP